MNRNVPKSKKRSDNASVLFLYHFDSRGGNASATSLKETMLSINSELFRSEDVKVHFVINDIVDRNDNYPKKDDI